MVDMRANDWQYILFASYRRVLGTGSLNNEANKKMQGRLGQIIVQWNLSITTT